MNIAIFGDLHGKVLLPFYLAARWQQEHGEEISYALCTGDVGVYRCFDTMERTSQRFARKHPEELGFSKFFYNKNSYDGRLQKSAEVEGLLHEAKVNLFFVAGNHEEHQFIGDIRYNYSDSLSEPVAVDYDWEGIERGLYGENDFRGYGKIMGLPEGPVVQLADELDIEALQPEAVVNLRAINGLPNYTLPEAWRGGRKTSVDILLTHETYKGRLRGLHPTGRLDNAGSEDLYELIKKIGPKYHFFGHYHWYYPEQLIEYSNATFTRSIGLNEVNFDRISSTILPGSFGILRIPKTNEPVFEIVDDKWFKNLTFQDCEKYL